MINLVTSDRVVFEQWLHYKEIKIAQPPRRISPSEQKRNLLKQQRNEAWIENEQPE
jgi:hypothetical protein